MNLERPNRFPRSTTAVADASLALGWAPALVGLAPQPVAFVVWIPVVVWWF